MSPYQGHLLRNWFPRIGLELSLSQTDRWRRGSLKCGAPELENGAPIAIEDDAT
jgi:hypothetical protein